MAIIGQPTASQYASAMATISMAKAWGIGAINWLDAGGKPKGFKFRQHLNTGAGAPAGLLVDGYFKPSDIPGERDKLSLSLLDRGTRILGLDENGVTRHFNEVGWNRPFFRQYVGHPHVHTPSVDSLCGYAEPIPESDLQGHWAAFAAMANIHGAPRLDLPMTQGLLTL